MKKLLAIAFSDLHINLWAKFNGNNKRTLNSMRVLLLMHELSRKHKVPILFGGDMFHKPENIDSELLDILVDQLADMPKLYSKNRIFGISGNHDMKYSNTISKPSTSLFRTLTKMSENFVDMDMKSVVLPELAIHGVPYLDKNIGLTEHVSKIQLAKGIPNILLLHTDYPGAKDTDGMEIGSVENLNVNTLSRFDLVLIGHIHKPQKLGKKIYMIGSTNQQRRTDIGCELGYIEIYNDLSVKHVHLGTLPKFIDVEEPEQVKEDGNYYTVVPKKQEVKEVITNKIDVTLSKTKLARRYAREVGIVDKQKKKLLINILKKASND